MDPEVSSYLTDLARNPARLDRFFADPAAALAPLPFSPEDKAALERLDREALLYLVDADRLEPEQAPEHPSSRRDLAWVSAAIAFGGCAAYVVVWLLWGGGPT